MSVCDDILVVRASKLLNRRYVTETRLIPKTTPELNSVARKSETSLDSLSAQLLIPLLGDMVKTSPVHAWTNFSNLLSDNKQESLDERKEIEMRSSFESLTNSLHQVKKHSLPASIIWQNIREYVVSRAFSVSMDVQYLYEIEERISGTRTLSEHERLLLSSVELLHAIDKTVNLEKITDSRMDYIMATWEEVSARI